MALRREEAEKWRLADADYWREQLPPSLLTDGWEGAVALMLASPIDTWHWNHFNVAAHLRGDVALIEELTTTELRWAWMQQRVDNLARKAILEEAPTAETMALLRRRVSLSVLGAIVPRHLLTAKHGRFKERVLWPSRLPRPKLTSRLVIADAIIQAQLAHPHWSMLQCQLWAWGMTGGEERAAARIKFGDLSPDTQALILTKLRQPQTSNVAASQQLGKSRSWAGKRLYDLRRRYNRRTLLKLVKEANEKNNASSNR